MVLRAAMLLSLIPVAAAAAAAAKCSLPHPGIDWLNSHHQSAHPTESYEECCALCEASAACKAFTFQTQQKSCYLKGDNSGQQKNPQCISGCKGPCPPTPPPPPRPPPPPPPPAPPPSRPSSARASPRTVHGRVHPLQEWRVRDVLALVRSV
jgi:hypothetical protein